MSMSCKRIRAALACVLCAAALIFPARIAESVAYAVEAPRAGAESLADNDALFYGYLLQRAGVSNDASLMADAGSQLNEKDRELYDKLKEFISKIASGEQTSTILTITYDDFPKVWTAAELGVSDIFSPQGKAALSAKINECYNYDTDAVFDALLSDFPYELYWYNKSGESGGGVGFRYVGAAYSGSASRVELTSVPAMTITMSVSQNYGSGTTVNRTLHKGIEKVVSNATAIVQQYSARSDYEKLRGYSKEICDRVEYDTAAVENHAPYGDPWQLISVFDDDTSTNVVCEGYSKAFKYLCDLSAFSSPNVECYLVTGYLPSGTGAGEHMWNIVTMENGKSYLVDVTNSDSNGGPDFLLLKGGSPHSQNPSQYTFYGDFTFIYDADTVKLWGQQLLTLDTADYQPSSSSPPDSAPASEYEYELRKVATSSVGVTVEIANHSGSGATLIVALYAENGQFLRSAIDNEKIAGITKGTSDSVLLSLDTTGAKNAKAFLLNDTQKPLCPAFPYPVG